MIQMFIEYRQDVIDRANIRKKLTSILRDGAKTTDVALIKHLEDKLKEKKEIDDNVVHVYTHNLPR